MIIGCECSGTIRDCFATLGFDAWSCDILPCEKGRWRHLQCDVMEVLGEGWDLGGFHPPCDFLTVSGNRWFSVTAKARPGVLTGTARKQAQEQAIAFVDALWNSPIPHLYIENPIGRLSTLWRKPSQVIQPWQFWDGEPGKGEVKATCLWLKNLPKLTPTTPHETGRHPACWLHPPGPQRKRNRSVSYSGIGKAMAQQWGDFLTTDGQVDLFPVGISDGAGDLSGHVHSNFNMDLLK